MQTINTNVTAPHTSTLGRSRRYTKKTGALTPPDVKGWEQIDLSSPIILQKSASMKVDTSKVELKSPIANTPKGIKRKKKDDSYIGI